MWKCSLPASKASLLCLVGSASLFGYCVEAERLKLQSSVIPTGFLVPSPTRLPSASRMRRPAVVAVSNSPTCSARQARPVIFRFLPELSRFSLQLWNKQGHGMSGRIRTVLVFPVFNNRVILVDISRSQGSSVGEAA